MSGERKLSLSEQQRRVVEGHGNQVVVAGAGTGKTETLTQRILHLLEDEDACRLHEIVALTFTDKAAGEMRRRVYQSLLQRLLREEDPQKRQALDALRAGFAEQNRIGTFDAFNHRLLSLHPEYDLLPPAFSPMSPHDQRELRQLLVRAFWNHAESLEGDNRDDFFYLLDRYERPSVINLIETLAREEKEVLEQLSHKLDYQTFERDLRAIADGFAARLERREAHRLESLWRRYLQTLPQTVPPALLATLQNPDELRLKECALLTQKHSWKVNWRKALLKNEPHLEALLDQLETEALPALGLWRDAENALSQTLAAMQNGESNYEADWQAQEVLRRLAPLAIWWQQKREELLFRRGWADFPDVHRAAWRLLQQQPEVREKLRAGSRHILVDEFQDTNRGQWKFVDAFRRDDNVLLVGDGKQAIYGFRGGDIAVFETVRERELQECEIHELSISRRSAPAIVNFCNEVFASVLPSPDGEDAFVKEEFEAGFQRLECGRDDGVRGSVRLLHAETSSPLAGVADNADETEQLAEALAIFLRELQDDADSLRAPSGALPPRLRQPEYSAISEKLARDEAATIGVLFRTHQRKALFETALRRHGVRYASVKGIGFYQTPAVGDTWNLLRFWADADDEIAVAGVLRSALVGLSDLALLEIRTQAPETSLWTFLETLEVEQRGFEGDSFLSREEDRCALRIGLPRLRAWKSAARVHRASEVLESVLSQTEVAFYDELHSDATQRSENWRKVLDLMRAREAEGQGSPRALAAYLEAQLEADERESEAALPEGGAVQLMTIFAAKGLGFPMTIVAELDGKPRREVSSLKCGELPATDGKVKKYFSLKVKLLDSDESDDKEQKNTEPVLWTILGAEERARQDAEFRRLLYVACTRAADHLLLAWPSGEVADTSWAAMLAPFVAKLENVSIEDGDRVEANETRAIATASQKIASILAPWERGVLPSTASVSQLMRQLENEGDPPSHGSRLQRELGTALHRLLKSGANPDRARCESVALAQNLPHGCAAQLFVAWQGAHRWLQSEQFDLDTARREIGFTIPISALDGVLPEEVAPLLHGVEYLSGQIDLLIARRDENGVALWSVVDFKTTRVATDLDDLIARRLYDLQLRVYLAAARHLGMDVQDARLVVVDESGVARAACFHSEYSG
jgi:ATP-dependent helicase/nuclease subunit A